MSDQAAEQITPEHIVVREVTSWRATFSEEQPGTPATWPVQLILDEGAAEYVLRPTADDMDTLQDLFCGAAKAYFDSNRKVLMFGVRSVG